MDRTAGGRMVKFKDMICLPALRALSFDWTHLEEKERKKEKEIMALMHHESITDLLFEKRNKTIDCCFPFLH